MIIIRYEQEMQTTLRNIKYESLRRKTKYVLQHRNKEENLSEKVIQGQLILM